MHATHARTARNTHATQRTHRDGDVLAEDLVRLLHHLGLLLVVARVGQHG